MGSEKVDEKIPVEGEGKWSSQTEWEANGILNEQANSISLCLFPDQLGA